MNIQADSCSWDFGKAGYYQYKNSGYFFDTKNAENDRKTNYLTVELKGKKVCVVLMKQEISVYCLLQSSFTL